MKLLTFIFTLMLSGCATSPAFIYVKDINNGARYEVPIGAPQFNELSAHNEGDTVQMFAPDMRFITVKIEKL